VTTATAAPWRIRLSSLHSGWVLGAGFQVAPRLALTCWHVVEKHQKQGARITVTGPAGWSGSIGPEDLEEAAPGTDVALLRLPGAVPAAEVAPMGPAEPPAPGQVLTAFGFPEIGNTAAAQRMSRRDNPGIWTRVEVEGLDLATNRVWLTSHASHTVPLQEGFSGGPVVDPDTSLVVGMTASAWVKESAAVMIPVAALAGCHPELRRILRSPRLADPDFVRGGDALDAQNYPAALADFRAVCARRPENPDAWYYVALAALRGQRPRAHTTTYIEEVDRLLEHASSLPSARPHVPALRALIREDHYQSRGITSEPTAADLFPPANSVPLKHTAEICRHVPAPETFIWQELNRWRST
jgi:hypothetical protein